MSSSSSPAQLPPWEKIDRITNRREMFFQVLPQIKNALPQLPNIKSCAIIGCGGGYLELEFICRCLPNVKKLTVVDPDSDMIAACKTRAAQLLPNVNTDFYQETAQSWNPAYGPFDTVLLFHCLYYIPQLERPELFKKLFNNVLTSDGLVIILSCPCNLQNPTMFNKLVYLVDLPSYNVYDFADGVQVCDMMTSVGFRNCYQLPVDGIEYQIDVEEPNDILIAAIMFCSRGKLSLEKVRRAVKAVVGGRKTLHHDMWLGVFEKL